MFNKYRQKKFKEKYLKNLPKIDREDLKEVVKSNPDNLEVWESEFKYSYAICKYGVLIGCVPMKGIWVKVNAEAEIGKWLETGNNWMKLEDVPEDVFRNVSNSVDHLLNDYNNIKQDVETENKSIELEKKTTKIEKLRKYWS